MSVAQSHTLPESRSEYRIEMLSTPEAIAGLKKIVNKWHKLAYDRYYTAPILYAKNDPKLQLAYDAQNITKVIKRALGDVKGQSIYVAYDSSSKAQGIAIGTFSPKRNELVCLSTNPENIELFEWQTRCKGVGRALITHVVQELYKNSKVNNPLILDSLPTAIPFYKSCGFTPNGKPVAGCNLTPMKLTLSAMKKLV